MFSFTKKDKKSSSKPGNGEDNILTKSSSEGSQILNENGDDFTFLGLKIKSAKTRDLKKQQNFIQQFFAFFNLHVFTPSSTSQLVRDALEQLIKNFNVKFEESTWNSILTSDAKKSLVDHNMLDDEGNDLTFSVVDCFKYLARKHGLSYTISNILMSSLTSTQSIYCKYQLAQTLKYSTCHTKTISSQQYVKVITALANSFSLPLDVSNTNESSNNSANVDPLVIQTISLLTQSLLMTIDDDTNIVTLNYDLTLKLRQFLPIVDANTKIEILQKLSVWDKKSNGLGSGADENVGNFGILSDTIDGTTIFESGASILYKIGAEKTENVVADKVKTQQVVQSYYKQSMSECVELENLNLSNALHERRGKSSANVPMIAKKPDRKGGMGSDRGFWSQIDTLWKLAGSKPLTESDITWLVSRTSPNYTSEITPRYHIKQTAKIFYKIVDYQEISSDVMTQLAVNFFSKKLTTKYDRVRITLLKTFDLYSKQLGGKIPPKITTTLHDFQSNDDNCTRPMKRIIWTILMQDDANLYQSFQFALDEIESCYLFGDLSGDLMQRIDYIGQQTVLETRTLELEQKFKFSSKLIQVVLDRKYHKEVRVKCAEIVEDFLTFDKKGLSKKSMSQFLSLAKWGAESGQFNSSLIRCVLKTLGKITSKEDAESLDLNDETLAHLVQLSTRGENLELEAFIVITLGNLINVCPSVHIPNVELLLSKLCRGDRICKETSTVHLEQVMKQSDNRENNEIEVEDPEYADDDDDENLVYISGYAANIILHCANKVSLSRNVGGIRTLIDAVQSSKDKMTKILSARILFEISTIEEAEPMSLVFVDSLKIFTMHNSVYDVQVYCTATYCVNMEKIFAYQENGTSTKSPLTDEDCDLLTKLYVIDGSYGLGDKDYTEFVNLPILNILKEQGKFITFSHDTFQLLTFLLNEEHHLESEIMKIFENYFVFTSSSSSKTNGRAGDKLIIRNNCPEYVFASIENIFKGQHGNLFERAGKLMFFLSRKQNCVISGEALCHAYQILLSINDSSNRLLCFKILFAGFCTNEVPTNIFRTFDCEFLVRQISSLSPEKKLKEISVTTRALVHSALKSLLEYQNFGQRLTMLHWTVYERLFKLEQFQSQVVRSLIVASENYQSLPSSLIETVFTSFGSDGNTSITEEKQLNILSLALAIVQNSQILPKEFVSKLVDIFSKETAQGMTVGESDIYDQILLILTNLLKQRQPLPIGKSLKNVSQHLCNLYVNSKQINQKMGVVLKWKNFRAKTKNEMTMQEAAEIIVRVCKFWKKSRNHKHRLEILSALYGIVGSELRKSGNRTVNFESVKHCLILAMSDRNLQIMESGAQTFLLLNSKTLNCTTSDFELLLSIQSQPNVTPNFRRQLVAFLLQNFNRIPKALQKRFKLINELEQLDNKSFIEILSGLLDQTHNYEMLQTNPIFYERFLLALLATGDDSSAKAKAKRSLICQVVEILTKMPSDLLANVPSKLMDAIGILLTSKFDENIARRCKALLARFVNTDENVKVRCLSTAFFKYLSKSRDWEVLEIAVKIFDSRSHLLKEKHVDILKQIKFQLETRIYFNASGFDTNQLGSFIKHISSSDHHELELADEKEFHQVTKLYLGIMNSDTVDEDDRMVVLNLLLSNYIKCFHSQLNIKQLSGFSEVVQSTIQQFATSLMKNVKLCLQITLSYTILVSKGCIQELALCLEVFTNIFQRLESKKIEQHYRHLYPVIFDAVSSTIRFVCQSNQHEIRSVVPEQARRLVEDNLKNPCSTMRLLSFQAAFSLEQKELQAVKTTQSAGGVSAITGHILMVYNQIFGGKTFTSKEMQKNMNFAHEMAELLFSISYWDLQSLQQEDREKWKTILLSTNFVAQFGKTDYEKFELMMKLRDYFHGVSNDETEIREDILQSLTLLLTKEYPLLLSFDQVSKILNLMEMIPSSQIIGILNELSLVEFIMSDDTTAAVPKLFKIFVDQLETIILLNHLKKLLSNVSVNLDILEMQVSSLMTSTSNSFSLAYDLLQMIDNDHEEVNITSLNELIEILVQIGGIDHSFYYIQNHILVSSRLQHKHKLNDLIVLMQSHFLLLQISHKTGEKQQELAASRLGNIFKTLLKNGISLEQIHSLISLTVVRTSTTIDDGSSSTSSVDLQKFRKIFDHIAFQLTQYHIKDGLFFNQLLLTLQNSDLNWHAPDVINICNKTINNYVFDNTQGGRKQLDKILDEFKLKNPETYAYFLQLKTADLHEIGQIFDEVNNRDLVVRDKEISAWTISDITEWAVDIKSGSRRETGNAFIVEALAVANRAFHLVTKFYLTDIQILTCTIALLDKANGRESLRSGQLFQVGTGSGKSAIVSIISALTCVIDGNNKIEKATVDIYTSSSVLAQRDAREWTEFYAAFELTCSHNDDVNDRYVSGEKLCYRDDIVYGDCSQFQFDYLRHHYSNLGTLGARKCSFAVIDEVDTMLIDDSSKLARLSSTIPGMDLVQVVLHCMWDRLTFVGQHLFSLFGSIYYLEGQIRVMPDCVSYAFADKETYDLLTVNDIKAYIANGGDLEQARIQKVEVPIANFVSGHLQKFVTNLIDGEYVKLPLHLKTFAKSQIGNWIESSLQAVAYQENVNYIIDDGQVKPVDFVTTGVIQGNCSWNNGLHQFLQIKHGLELTTESVTTNYLSNIATFKKYGTNVIGFTGTLGSPASQTILMDVYKVKLCIIPDICFKRYIRFPDIVANDKEIWLNQIVLTSLQETSKKRGVLIICETIREAELVHATLTKLSQVKVKMYTKNQRNQERQIERIHPGDIIVATNLAGRGTDIKTASVEPYGGLHVILSFLPMSLRVDEQAFGRTSRQGKNGTGQLIIVGSDYGSSSGSFDSAVNSEMLIEQRDKAETARFKHFSSADLPVIQLKDCLFDKFSETFNELRSKLRDQNGGWYSRFRNVVNTAPISPSPTETIYLQAVEERWAMFIRSFDSMYKEEKSDKFQILKKFGSFSQQLLDDFESDSLIQNSNNLFYFIQLGNYQYMADTKWNQTLDAAEKYFNRAIGLDSDHEFSAPAIVGKAFLYLKGREHIVLPNSREENYKDIALKLLNEARPMLYDEIATLTFVQILVQRQHDNKSTPLHNQMIEKINLCGTYLKNVEATIDIVKKSLRRVLCTGTIKNETTNGEYKETKQIPNSVMVSKSREIPNDFIQFNKYDLTFNDLTMENNKDQRALTVKVLRKDDTAEKTITPLQNIANKATNYFIRITHNEEKYDDDEMVKQGFSKISFSLKNVNPFKVLTELTNTKGKVDIKKFEFNVEALGLDLSDNDNFKSIVSNLKILKPKSYCLSLTLHPVKVGDKARIFLKNLKNFEVIAECHAYTKSKTFTDDSENASSTEELDTFLDDVKEFGRLTIKIFRKSEDEVHNVVHTLPSHFDLDEISNNSLTIKNVSKKINDKSKKTAWEICMQDCASGIYLIVETADAKQGVSVVPILRQFTSDIPLSIHGLSLEFANKVLKHARVNEESIVQQDLKELTAVYCSDRLPLKELKELSARGVTLIPTFNEQKFVPWGSVMTIAGLATVQTLVGGLLIATGIGAPFGTSLIKQGISDLTDVRRAYTEREFNWSKYGIQKAAKLTTAALSLEIKEVIDDVKEVVKGDASDSNVVSDKSDKMVLKVDIENSGTNLKSLVLGQVSVESEKHGANALAQRLLDQLVDFSFDKTEKVITDKVKKNVNQYFMKPEFENLLRVHFVHNKNALENKMQGIVNSTTNPKSSAWNQRWNSVGQPLCQDILSSPQFLSNSISRDAMVTDFINGSKDINVIIEKVCMEISKNLEGSQPGVSTFLQNHCGFSAGSAENLAALFKLDQIKFDAKRVPKLAQFNSEDQHEKVVTAWKELEVNQKNLDIGTNPIINRMQKSIVDTITSHLIRVTKSHFVSPAMSAGIGVIAANVCTELQNRFLVAQSRSTENQLKSGEEEAFNNHIQSNDKLYTMALQKRDLIGKVQEMPGKNKDRESGVADLMKYVEGVIDGVDADMVVMFILAKENGAKIKIVDDTDYELTPEDIANDVHVVIYDKNSEESKAGRYRLRNPDGSISSPNPVSENDCGYMVMSTITEKSVIELRLQVATKILENPENFTEIQSVLTWIQSKSVSQIRIESRKGLLCESGLDTDKLVGMLKNVKRNHIKKSSEVLNFRTYTKIDRK